MADTLFRLIAVTPAAWLLPLLAVGYGAVLAAFHIDDAARELVADIRLAMKRADLSLDYVSRVIRVPGPKLSDQLLGKQPFTSFWRFVTPEITRTGFWHEFFAVRAERHGGVYVRGELAALVRGVDQLVHQKKKAS